MFLALGTAAHPAQSCIPSTAIHRVASLNWVQRTAGQFSGSTESVRDLSTSSLTGSTVFGRARLTKLSTVIEHFSSATIFSGCTRTVTTGRDTETQALSLRSGQAYLQTSKDLYNMRKTVGAPASSIRTSSAVSEDASKSK